MVDNITFINLTKYDLSIRQPGKPIIDLPSSPERKDLAPRLRDKHLGYDYIGDLRIANVTVFEMSQLPEPQKDVYYIVSGTLARAIGSLRQDVLTPNMKTVVRDDQGKIVGVRELLRYKDRNIGD